MKKSAASPTNCSLHSRNGSPGCVTPILTSSRLKNPTSPESPGTAFSAIFTYDITRWLVNRHPRSVDIDWDATDPSLLGPLLRRLHPFFDEDLLVEANIPYLDWFRAAKKGRGSDLQWLISRIEQFPLKAGRTLGAVCWREARHPVGNWAAVA